MSMKSISFVIVMTLAISAIPAGAQEKLGDYVAQYGYDWMIGNWAATSEDGRPIELEYKWILDKCAMCVNLTMGDFKYHGLIMGMLSREEIVQVGADNMGGTWKGSWGEDYDGAVNRNERLDPYGSTQTMDMVFIKINNDSFKVKQYSVESGYRSSTPIGETTFKRIKEDASKQAAGGNELEGTWVGTDAGGYEEWTFSISKGKVEVKGPDSMFFSGTVKLDTGTNPKQAEFKIEKSSEYQYAGETSLGIYKLDGKKLTLATCEPASINRPEYFDSTGGVMVFSLTRQ